jgi:hypothetical protein
MAATVNELGPVVWVCFSKLNQVHVTDEPRYRDE